VKEEPRDDTGRPLGMYDYRDLSAADKQRHDAYYGPPEPTIEERVARAERRIALMLDVVEAARGLAWAWENEEGQRRMNAASNRTQKALAALDKAAAEAAG